MRILYPLSVGLAALNLAVIGWGAARDYEWRTRGIPSPLEPAQSAAPSPALAVGSHQVQPESATEGSELTSGDEVTRFFAKHCLECHGAKKHKGDLRLDVFRSDAALGRDLRALFQLQNVLSQGLMPPEKEPQPSAETRHQILGRIRKMLANFTCSGNHDPGRRTLRRLNRREYANTLRDLLGLEDWDPPASLPTDDTGYGFDDIADVLSISDLLAEKYFQAAEDALDQTLFGLECEPLNESFAGSALEVSAGKGGVEGGFGFMLYTQGVLEAAVTLPRSGRYRLRVTVAADQAGPEKARWAILIGQQRAAEHEVTAPSDERQTFEDILDFPAGKTRIGVEFLNDFYDKDAADPLQRDRNLVVDSLDIEGPVNAPAAKPSAAHDRVFFRVPGKDGAPRECAREIIARFARRAYRRPVTPEEIAALLALYDAARAAGDDHERAVRASLLAVLVSPHFLFMVERDSPGVQPGTVHSLGPHEVAVRLSYFLWSSQPDEELSRLAEDGSLLATPVLLKQVRRMIGAAQSEAFLSAFAGQWLELNKLNAFTPDSARFPGVDRELLMAMRRETELCFKHILDNNRSILDLLDSRTTFLNDRLAAHYGYDLRPGPEFRRVEIPDPRRGGLLTQAGLLVITSNSTRTSPVKRGKFILETLLGAPPPPPPPDAGVLPENPGAQRALTLRQEMEAHRKNPDCYACHARMDPLGFTLENFDAVGRWRDAEGGQPLDVTGLLANGTRIPGARGLQQYILERREDVARCLVSKLMTYALGRGLEASDLCMVNDICRATAASSYRLRDIIEAIVQTDAFLKRRAGGRPSIKEG